MSPIEVELFSEFKAILLETLVPLEVQLRIPEVRKIWQEMLATDEGRGRVEEFFAKAIRERRSVGDAVIAGIAEGEGNIWALKNKLYDHIGNDRQLISKFIGRVVTDGNEQCPYWDGAYVAPPRPGLIISDHVSGSIRTSVPEAS